MRALTLKISKLNAQIFGYYEAMEVALEVEDADAFMWYQIQVDALNKYRNQLQGELEAMEEVA